MVGWDGDCVDWVVGVNEVDSVTVMAIGMQVKQLPCFILIYCIISCSTIPTLTKALVCLVSTYVNVKWVRQKYCGVLVLDEIHLRGTYKIVDVVIDTGLGFGRLAGRQASNKGQLTDRQR